MSKNQNFKYLDFIKGEKEEDEKRTDDNRSEKIVWIILILCAFFFLSCIIFTLALEVGRVGKGTHNEPIETPMEQEQIQTEMKGWRKPSAVDTITHKKL